MSSSAFSAQIDWLSVIMNNCNGYIGEFQNICNTSRGTQIRIYTVTQPATLYNIYINTYIYGDQPRHFIQHLYQYVYIRWPNPPLYTTSMPTLSQFAPHFYNLLHTFTICSTLLQFAPHFYNLLHTFTICSTLLQFAPHFYNLLHTFAICNRLLQFAPHFHNLLQTNNVLHTCTICSTLL